MQTTVIKLTYEEQMRRFPFQGESFNALYGQIVGLLSLEQGADLVLKYTDEEGDLITISSDLELKSAVVPGKLLRISAVRKTPNVQETLSAPPGFNHQQGFDPRWGHPHRRGPHPYGPGPHPHPHGPHHGHHHRGPHSPKDQYFGPPQPGFFGPRHGPHGHHGHCKKDKFQKKYEKQMEKEFEKEKDKLFARFAKDVTVEDGYQLSPNVPFVKTWRLRNEGSVAWPLGSVLKFVGKHSDNLSGPEAIAVEPIAPGQEVDVSVNLVSPAKPGRYTGYWRMCTAEGKKFGQRVWVSIVVPPFGSSSSSESDKEADRIEALVDIVLANEQLRSIGIKRHRVYRLLKRCDGDIDKVMEVLEKKVAKKMKKHTV